MADTQKYSLYISGYTGKDNKDKRGIYHYCFDGSTGHLTRIGLAAESIEPSFIVQHGQRLYSTNEVGSYKGDDSTGYVSCYRHLEDGRLELVGEQPSGGKDPCYAIVDRHGHNLFVANYSSGTVASFDVKSSQLGPRHGVAHHDEKATHKVPERQEAPHAHSIDLDPVAQEFALSMDLGCDRAILYRLNRSSANSASEGNLVFHSSFKFPDGAGPRHLVFAPNNHGFCYVACELSNEIFMLEFDFDAGELKEVQRIQALPIDGSFTGTNLASEIDITPNGKFLYCSLRGHDSIAIFLINDHTGKLSLVGHESTRGEHPRHFTLDPTGNYILVGNQNTDTVVVFQINHDTGLLTHIQTVEHPQPTCIKFWS